MDVYISEEYVAQRRAERRAARNAAAAAARCGEEKARADGEQKRWTTAAWAKEKRTVDGNAGANNPGGGATSWLVGEDAVLSYFSA